jgi:nucleotide-binding universal stress UspA family protein
MSEPIKKLLFTTDLSEGARQVFKQAVRLAESCNASIIMLHVIEDSSSPQRNLVIDLMGQEVYEKLAKENEAYARNILIGKQKEVPILTKTLEELSKKGITDHKGDPKVVNVENVIVTVGKPEEVIVQQAEINKCDVIVMGYEIRNVVSKVMLGGTTRKVMRHWKKPVFLVPFVE